MADKQHVVIVNGYGCHTSFDDRISDRFLEGYRRYLQRVAGFIDTNIPDLLILTGGETKKKSAPGRSEAKVMWEYIFPRMIKASRDRYLQGKNKNVMFDERSFTTWDNSACAYLALLKAIGAGVIRNEPCRITHFCEAHRAPVVNMCDRNFLIWFVQNLNDLRVETESWELADPFRQVKNLIYNKLAIKYPWLGLAERERRKRIKRAEQI